MRLDDLDASWNFVYMGFSKKESAASAFVYYGNSKTWQFYVWPKIKHNEKPDKLEFVLGAYLENKAVNGHFFDVKFCASTFGCFVKNQEAALDYLKKKADRPPVFKATDMGKRDVLKDQLNFTNEVFNQ